MEEDDIMNKLIKAAKYIWDTLLWVPLVAFAVGSLITRQPEPAGAFDAGINAPAIFYNVDLSTEPVLVSSRTYIVDLYDKQVNKFSAQVVVSSVTIPPINFTDGNASTATITIASNTALAAATSWITITVTSNTALAPTTAYITIVISSNTALKGAQLTLIKSTAPFGIVYSSYQVISGTPSLAYVTYSTPTFASVQTAVSSYTFTQGKDWFMSSTWSIPSSSNNLNLVDAASNTAISIANALNFSTYGIIASTPNAFMPPYISTGTNVVVVQAILAGKYANAWLMQSSTQFAMTVCYSTGPQNSNPSTVGTPIGISTTTAPLNFVGGQDPAYLTINTTWTYRLIAGRDFAIDPFVQGSSATAFNIAMALNSSSQAAFGLSASTAMCVTPSNLSPFAPVNNFLTQFSTSIYSPSVVIVLAVTPGFYANNWTIASSTQFALSVAYSTGFQNGTANPAFTLARSTPLNFNGGLDPVMLKVNGITLLNGRDWFSSSFASMTALSISSAISGNGGTGNIKLSTNVIQSTASMFTSGFSIVYMTSTYVNKNFFNLYTSSQFALTVSTDPMGFSTMSVFADGSSTGSFKGGFDTQIDTTAVFISTGTGFAYKFLATGSAVWLSTTNGQTPPGALTWGTTYYLMPVTISTPNAKLPPSILVSSSVPLSIGRAFTLAQTSTGAFAGIPFTTGLSTQNLAGGNTYTLNPINFQFAANIIWKFSNDNQNWMSVNQASFTVSNTSLANSTTYYDFGLLAGNQSGTIGYRYIRSDVQSSSNTPCNVHLNIVGKY